MKASELRIGNCLNFKRYGNMPSELKTVAGIDAYHIYFDKTKNDSATIHLFEGIPLTTDMLEQIGFEKSQSNDVFEREIYSIQVANNTSLYFDAHKDWMMGDKDVEWYLSHEWNNNHFKNDFWGCPKYLHQVQNLFYSLSGEELNVEKLTVKPL